MTATEVGCRSRHVVKAEPRKPSNDRQQGAAQAGAAHPSDSRIDDDRRSIALGTQLCRASGAGLHSVGITESWQPKMRTHVSAMFR